jgi:cytochrome c oxidase assembly protein subunit 15
MMQKTFVRDRGILIWLASGCLMIFIMVIVGGITRLTGSGLSITEWKVVTGTIPPLSEAAWHAEFEKYKQIPQYKLINAHFTLDDFKSIYWWEYIHRLIGRLIGLVFIIPFIYFYIKKRISKELMPQLLIMFLLGALQGFIGWYMVSSGLTENTRVSHLRLALHLAAAFVTFGYIYFVLLKEYNKGKLKHKVKSFFPFILLMLIFIQIIYGAFVAGLQAGYVYNTWPMMGEEWIAESVTFAYNKEGMSSLVNNIATVQFIHRNLAYLIAVASVFWWLKARKGNEWQARTANMLMTIVLIQAVIGIFTLLSHVPVWMGVLHQAMAFILFAAAIWNYYIFRYHADDIRIKNVALSH